MPCAGDDMIAYWLGQAGRIPLLTAAEELHLGSLVRRWQDHPKGLAEDPAKPDPEHRAVIRRGLRARDRMVSANLRLVAHVTRKRRPRLGVHIPDAGLPDLLQAGAIGLQRGIEKFDPTRGYKVSTFCYWWIHQALSKHADWYGRTIRIAAGRTDLLAKAKGVTATLTTRLGRPPTRAELAAALEVSVEDLEHLLLIAAGCYSLDAPPPGGCADGGLLGDVLAAPDPGFDGEELEARLLCLDPIELRLITARWGLDGEPRFLHQLAEQEAISEGEVKRVLAMAMAKMRGEAVPVAAPRRKPKPKPPPPPVVTLPPSQPGECCQLDLTSSTLNSMAWTTWRNDCAPIIADVIKRVGKDDPKALRKALLKAYPYGQRSRHPYKIWRDEIRQQLNPPTPTAYRRREKQAQEEAPGQISLTIPVPTPPEATP
jgi:RNA polymerase primary sigma factor